MGSWNRTYSIGISATHIRHQVIWPSAPKCIYFEDALLPESKGSFVIASESGVSSSTPNFWVKKKVYTTWQPKKKNFLLIEPTPPVLRIPRVPRMPIYRPIKRWPPKKQDPKQPRKKYLGKHPKPYVPISIDVERKRIKDEQIRQKLLRRELQDKRHLQRFAVRFNKYKKLLVTVEIKRLLNVKKFKEATIRYQKKLLVYEKLRGFIKNGKPRFRRMRNIRELVINPYSRTRTWTSPATGYSDNRFYVEEGCRNGWNVNKRTSLYSGDLYFGVIQHTSLAISDALCVDLDAASSSSAAASADARARTKLREKLNQYDLHIGQIIAERHQTIGLIADIAKRVSNLAPKKLFSMKTIGRYLDKKLANDTLAFLFGVKPLLRDAYMAGEALAKLNDPLKEDKIVVRSVSKGSSSAIKTQEFTLGWPVTKKYMDRTIQQTTAVQISYVLEYKITNGPLSTLQGLGLINPAEIAWELMPWSFVVDWFIPIGNYIQGLTSDAGLEFKQGTKVTTTTVTTKVSWSGRYDTSATGQDKWQSATASRIKETKIREVLTSSPGLSFPEFKNPLSMYHVIEALALLKQKFLKG